MKLLALLMVISVFSLPAWGSPERATNNTPSPDEQKPSVMVKVKRLASKGKTEHYAGYGSRRSYSKGYETFSSGFTLEADVHLISKSPVTLELEWYFIARTSNGAREWACGKGSKTLELGIPVTSARQTLESPTLQGSSLDGNSSKVEGYLVLVKWQDKVVKAVGSSKDIEDIAYSPEKLRKLDATAEPGENN